MGIAPYQALDASMQDFSFMKQLSDHHIITDHVVAINGKSTIGFTMQQAAALVMKDTAVVLTVEREIGNAKGGYGVLSQSGAAADVDDDGDVSVIIQNSQSSAGDPNVIH